MLVECKICGKTFSNSTEGTLTICESHVVLVRERESKEQLTHYYCPLCRPAICEGKRDK